MKYTHERNYGCRINDELVYRGLKTMVIENEVIRVSLLMDQGTDIYQFVHKPTDTDFMFVSPLGVRPHLNHMATREATHGPFSDHHEGGWQEVLPNGGRSCEYRGAQMGIHGEVWGVPWRWQILEDSPEIVSVRMWVRTYRTPFLLEKTLTLRSGSGALEIDETLTNEGDSDIDLMWGHHPAFGSPFLSEHCVINSGARKVVVDPNVPDDGRFKALQEFTWPRGRGKAGNYIDVRKLVAPEEKLEDMLYLTDLEDGWYSVTNRDTRVGFGMSFDTNVFKHIWYWISLCGNPDAPGWGRNYVMALEPFSSYPAILTECMKYNRQMKMKAGERVNTWMKAVAYNGFTDVTGIDDDGVVTGA